MSVYPHDEVMWAAGFIEGEGYFCLDQYNKRKDGTRPAPGYHIGVNQVNVEPLLRLQALFGGRLCERKNVRADGIPRQVWTSWDLRKRADVLRATRALLPHLSTSKRERIPWLAEVEVPDVT